jgi:predicted amidohydrolase
VRGDVEANLREHLRLVELAAAHGARIVLFPELSLTGYELELAASLAMSVGDPRLDRLADAAALHAVAIVAGAPVRVDAELHIGAFLVSPDRTVSLYTKQRLGAFGAEARCDGVVPPPEASVFRPGRLDPLLRIDGDLAAVAICADIGLAAHPLRAAQRGATLYLASMFVIPSEFESERAKLERYALEHSLIVAFANFGAASGGLAAAGRSSLWSERGELLVQLPPSGAGVAVATSRSGGWHVTTAMLGST